MQAVDFTEATNGWVGQIVVEVKSLLKMYTSQSNDDSGV